MKKNCAQKQAFDPYDAFYMGHYIIIMYFGWLNILAHRYLASKKLSKKIFKCFYLSLFIITQLFLKSESILPFKPNQLMVLIGKKRAPGNHESSLKIFHAKLFLARCSCANYFFEGTTYKLNFSYCICGRWGFVSFLLQPSTY